MIERPPLNRLPIFPLWGAVVFPGLPTALHIFEPRYRQMVSDALDGDRLIAVVRPRSTEGDPRERRPKVHSTVGVGQIVRHERLDDGRYNVLLAGLGRAAIVNELETDRLYRIVSATWSESDVDDAEARELAARARGLALANARSRHGEASAVWLQLASEALDPTALSNVFPRLLFAQPEHQHELLLEHSVHARLRRLNDELETSLLAAASPSNLV